jgi:AraC-like DNA-binding protein
LASTGRAFGLPFMRNSDIRYADTVPSAVGGITRFACEYAKEHGIDVEALLQKSGLTLGQIEQPSVRLSVRSQIKFLELAARAFQDDFLGFHLAQKFELRAIGLLYYVLASSDTLDEALQRAARYSTIVNEGIVLKFRNGKESGIAFEYVGVARRTDRHQIEFWMTALVRICRQLTGRRLPASRVQVAHQRSGDTSEMSAFFGGDVMFGAPVDEVAFPESSTPVALVGADSYLNHMLVKYCEEALARRETNRSPFGLEVENAITLLLPHGKARVGEVARKLGVSQRTLARRLASEGQTFAGVLQGLRSDLAKRHLADEGLSISQIAWLLGYQDVSAFTHAFKRWTGRAPGEVRQQSS